MPDAWDWVQEELKKIQDDMPADPEMMQVVDAISVADFWKRRYDEEQMLWARKIDSTKEEKMELERHSQAHEMLIKELGWKLKELERKWDQERLLLEDRLKTKETENALEKASLSWETRLQVLENENRELKLKLGIKEGVSLVPPHVVVQQGSGVVSPEADEIVRKKLEEIEKQKKEVEKALKDQEEILSAERSKWKKLEEESTQASDIMSKRLSGLKEREQEHFTILEDLARGFAHRVRNYLGIMSGTIQLCISTYKIEPEVEEQLKIVDQNAQEMLGSIEDFLKFARVPEMNIKKIDANSLLDECVRIFDSKFRAQNIRANKQYDVNIPIFDGDHALLVEGLGYILQNSVEAMPQGGQITLATKYDPKLEIISITISDTGIGISESHIKKIFQPYFSTKKGRKGLSLTSSKRIFNLHKGTLNIESSKDRGTTAVINLFVEPLKVTSDDLVR